MCITAIHPSAKADIFFSTNKVEVKNKVQNSRKANESTEVTLISVKPINYIEDIPADLIQVGNCEKWRQGA